MLQTAKAKWWTRSLSLEYRIYVHEGNAEIANVAKACADYIEQRK